MTYKIKQYIKQYNQLQTKQLPLLTFVVLQLEFELNTVLNKSMFDLVCAVVKDYQQSA